MNPLLWSKWVTVDIWSSRENPLLLKAALNMATAAEPKLLRHSAAR